MNRTKGVWLSICAATLLSFAPLSRAEAESAKRKAVRQLLAISGMSKMGDQILDQLFASFKQSFSVPDSHWRRLRQRMNTNELFEMIIPVYERHFTLGDIKALTAFYKSPVGRKFVRVQPKLLAESMQIGQRWGQNVAQKVMRELKNKKKRK